MADIRKNGDTSNLVRFILKNSSTGQGLTGLTSASSGLIISTIADNEASATAYTVAGSTIESIGTLGTFATPTATKCRFREVSSTNHKGLYEFQFANARFAVSSAKRLIISVTGATDLVDTDYEIEFTPSVNADQLGGMAAIVNGDGRLSVNIQQVEDQDASDYFEGLDDTVLLAIADLPTNAELAAALATADDATLAAIAAISTLLTVTGVALSAAQMNKIADHVRRRTQANVKASSDGDTISKGSEYGAIQQMQKSSVSGSLLTILNPDGSTLGTLALTSDVAAEPITSIG